MVDEVRDFLLVERLAVVFEPQLGLRQANANADAIGPCRIAGILKEFPDPAQPKGLAIVLNPTEVLENSLRRVVSEN